MNLWERWRRGRDCEAGDENILPTTTLLFRISLEKFSWEVAALKSFRFPSAWHYNHD